VRFAQSALKVKVMQGFLIVVHLIVVIALVTVVLLQRSEGGALGIGGGGGFMTGRGQANALSRATAILATLFFATSLIMSILAGWSRTPRSILDQTAPSSSTSQPASGGSVLDQLKKMENQRNETPAAPAPAAPAIPAPAAPEPAAPAPAAPADQSKP
jgi:preprotein translocase subunit SecG